MADEDWTTDPDVVLAAVAVESAGHGRWLYPEAYGQRTETGLRLLVPTLGMVLDATPSCDGSWQAQVHRVQPPRWYGIYDTDPGLFDLAVAVWDLDDHDPAWTVVVPRRAPRIRLDPGARVAQALLDALDGEIDDPWEAGMSAWAVAMVDRHAWATWARMAHGRGRQVVYEEGLASGVFHRDGKASF